MLASSAHKNISEAIEAARLASVEAREHVNAASNKLYPKHGKRNRKSKNFTRQISAIKQDAMQKIQDSEEPDWEIKLGLAEENISLTKTNVRLANISLTYVEEQAIKEQSEFDTWNKTMANQIQELRDKIAKAKHAAEAFWRRMNNYGSLVPQSPVTGNTDVEFTRFSNPEEGIFLGGYPKILRTKIYKSVRA
ncbi:hypothetical protein EVAR_72897_1 [Eumeta japonica]|uniref:Uncharacterized protein n=1 Tax=Eumeta variegata TaxID=151549 RepID=A0A4C1SR25_EUMVA|nr:hypothetical protein EVAR_72897_1 [Eumeta japonica]